MVCTLLILFRIVKGKELRWCQIRSYDQNVLTEVHFLLQMTYFYLALLPATILLYQFSFMPIVFCPLTALGDYDLQIRHIE